MDHFYHTIGEDWFTYPLLYAEMVRRFSSNSHFVEVGSWRGRSAAFMAIEILNSGKTITFDCVDPWTLDYDDYDPEEYLFDRESLRDPNWLFEEFQRNTKPVAHLLNAVRLHSLDAARAYEEDSLEFVFIDACHEYDAVRADIKAWLPKVKSGGVLAGHDYLPGYWDGVCRAVDDCFSAIGELESLSFQEHCWVFEKP